MVLLAVLSGSTTSRILLPAACSVTAASVCRSTRSSALGSLTVTPSASVLQMLSMVSVDSVTLVTPLFRPERSMTTALSVQILFSSALLISLTSAVLPLTLAETCTVSPLPLTGR